jgi:hypothetical protein
MMAPRTEKRWCTRDPEQLRRLVDEVAAGGGRVVGVVPDKITLGLNTSPLAESVEGYHVICEYAPPSPSERLQ